MANRGLSNQEISVVKAMIAEGMSAQDICGYMFRPDRSLNPAGVYEIKAGKTGSEIPPLSSEELAIWIATHPYFGTIASADLISELRKELRGLLRPKKNETVVTVDPKETTRLEFKETFHTKSFSEYARSLIGYSNHSGGFIVFGISDDQKVVGLKGDSFKKFDPQKASSFLKDLVSPTIRWDCFSMVVFDREIGVFYAQESELKPLITLKDADKVKAHTIYYRYEGETAQIRSGDLHGIIRVREQLAVQMAIAKLQQISGIGLRDAEIIDGSQSTTFSTPNQSAEAALGSDSAAAPIKKVIKSAAVTDLDILCDFIAAKESIDALSYIKQSAHETVRWLPLFFYKASTGLSNDDLLSELKASAATKPASLKHIGDRLSGKISAYREYLGAASQKFLKALAEGTLLEATDIKSARHLSNCLVGLPDSHTIDPNLLLQTLAKAVELYHSYDRDSAIGSNMRRSAARVDELLFR